MRLRLSFRLLLIRLVLPLRPPRPFPFSDGCIRSPPNAALQGADLFALPTDLVAHAFDLGTQKGKVGHGSLVGGGWPTNKNVKGTWSQGRMRRRGRVRDPLTSRRNTRCRRSRMRLSRARGPGHQHVAHRGAALRSPGFPRGLDDAPVFHLAIALLLGVHLPSSGKTVPSSFPCSSTRTGAHGPACP